MTLALRLTRELLTLAVLSAGLWGFVTVMIGAAALGVQQ